VFLLSVIADGRQSFVCAMKVIVTLQERRPVHPQLSLSTLKSFQVSSHSSSSGFSHFVFTNSNYETDVVLSLNVDVSNIFTATVLSVINCVYKIAPHLSST